MHVCPTKTRTLSTDFKQDSQINSVKTTSRVWRSRIALVLAVLETVDINESKDYAHFAKYFTYVIAFASHNNNMDEGIFNQFYTSNIWG